MTVTRRRGLWLALLAWLGMAVPGYPAGTLTPWPKPQFFDANGDPCASCRIFTYSAGTSTKLSTYSNVDVSIANTNPIVLDSAGRTAAIYLPPLASYKFVLAAAGSDDPPASPLWTQDNISNVPPSTVNLDVVGIVGEALVTIGQFVYLSDGTGGRTAGRWYLTDSDLTYASVTANAIGYVLEDGAVGEETSIRLAGRISGGFAGLSPGGLYYIAAVAGDLTATPPTNARVVGMAESSTTLVMSHHLPIPDASASWGGRVSTGIQSFSGEKTFLGGAPFFNASGQAVSARASGRIIGATSSTDAGNVGAGEDDLHSAVLVASALSFDTQVLRVTAWGTNAANANSKRVRCYFGATMVVDSLAATTNGGSWRVTVEVIRTGAATQRASGHYGQTDAAGVSATRTRTSAPTETLTNAITFKCTGEGVANNDIIQSAMVPEVVG